MPLTRTRQRSNETAAAPPAPSSGPGAPDGTRSRLRSRQTGTEVTQATRVNSLNRTEEPLVNEVTKHPVELDDCPHPARVRVSGGATINMGNYESIRVDVSIDWPCPPNEAALDATYQWLTETVDAKVQHELAVAKNEV